MKMNEFNEQFMKDEKWRREMGLDGSLTEESSATFDPESVLFLSWKRKMHDEVGRLTSRVKWTSSVQSDVHRAFVVVITKGLLCSWSFISEFQHTWR